MTTCILCGRPVVDRRTLWQKFIGHLPPMRCSATGLEGLACWRDLCERTGLDPDKVPPPPHLQHVASAVEDVVEALRPDVERNPTLPSSWEATKDT